jgi:hypothetical protein
MKVTVSEALRIKNELGNIINNIQRCSPLYGTRTQTSTLQDTNVSEIPVMDAYRTVKFSDFVEIMKKAFNVSEEINSKLANFNTNSGLSDKVRRLHNNEVMITVYNTAVSNSQISENKGYQVLGNDRILVTDRFVPFHSKSELKDKIKAYKTENRQIQIELDALNQKEIEFSFEYEDLESLNLN